MDQKVEHPDRIAVIGMAGRFPGASSIEHFAKNLCAGVESVSAFTDEQLLSAGVPPNLVQAPNYVKAGVVLEGFEPVRCRILWIHASGGRTDGSSAPRFSGMRMGGPGGCRIRPGPDPAPNRSVRRSWEGFLLPK